MGREWVFLPAHKADFSQLPSTRRDLECGLVAALRSPLRPQQIAEPLFVQSTGGDDPVVRNDSAAAAPGGGATDLTPPRQPRQNVVASPAVPFPKFRCIEVGQADLDPVVGVRRPAYAEAVAVADISNCSRERLPMPRRQSSLTGIGLRCGDSGQR